MDAYNCLSTLEELTRGRITSPVYERGPNLVVNVVPGFKGYFAYFCLHDEFRSHFEC